MLFACLFFLRLPVVRRGYSLQKLFLKGFEEDNSTDCYGIFLHPFKELTTLWLRLSPAGYTSPVKNPVLRAQSVGWNHLPLPGAV